MGYNRNLDRHKAASETRRQKLWVGVFTLIVLAGFSAAYVFAYLPEANSEPAILPPGTVIESIYWSDGDSGRVNELPFRLNNGDAPETGGVGAAIGGAKCEAEREWGFRAKEFMVLETKDGEQIITANYGQDRYGRWVLDIADDGRDLVELGMDNDFIRSWKHDGRKALEPRPNWCGDN